MHRLARQTLPFAILALAGCASAGDRLSDGIELQREGRFVDAAYRYADAVDKEADLIEARNRLVAVTDTAIGVAIERSEELYDTGDHIGAAEEFRTIDHLLARIREVRVSVVPPPSYGPARRDAFDWAIRTLMDDGARAKEEERFSEGRRALRRVLDDFAPSTTQRDEALDAELDLLLTWAGSDLDGGRFRGAFAHAGEASAVWPNPPSRVSDAVQRIQERALDLGTVAVAVLPVTSSAAAREALGPDFERRLADDLELDHWRRPPPFIAIADPLLVRREARAATRGDVISKREVRRVLERIGADFAVLIEVRQASLVEKDAKTELKEARTKDGRAVTYQVTRGRIESSVQVEVLILDAAGSRVANLPVNRRESASFERAGYRGDVSELSLGRNEARIFDADVQAEQRRTLDEKVLSALTGDIGSRAISTLLGRVR